MKYLALAALSVVMLLSGCVVYPVHGDGYRDHDRHDNHGYYHGNHDYPN